MVASEPRVLSIQSHVVSGYVGNKSATFPLQLLGFEVDAINSVQFSNHTGYRKVSGQILSDKDLSELVQSLKENDLDNYTHLLTGYIGSESFLNGICNVVMQLRAKNPELVYVCDPVMGDNGKMYVPPNLLPLYKEKILPLATIITPNQFELELLTDSKINSIEDAWKSIDILHAKGCKIVVISSSDLGDEEDKLIALASGNNERVLIKIPKLPFAFTGTGDLFASLLLAWMQKSGNRLNVSMENTVATVQAVLKRTIQMVPPGKEVTSKVIELKLIQSKSDIENPDVTIRAEVLGLKN